MAKMTKEEKKAKLAEKKAAKAAKKAARKQKLAEKKALAREKKRAKREAKKAKMLAKREKMKAKKLALKEKMRRAKEKAKAKALKNDNKKPIVKENEIDIRSAAKNMKNVLKHLAQQFAAYDTDVRAKKAKSIAGMGYVVTTIDGNVIVKFAVEKSKKDMITNTNTVIDSITPAEVEQPTENDVVSTPTSEAETVSEAELAKIFDDRDEDNEHSSTVDMIPAGDIYGQDGEVANIDNDDELNDGMEDVNDEDDFMPDSRDEQDEDLIDSRREFFGTYGDDGDMNDE